MSRRTLMCISVTGLILSGMMFGAFCQEVTIGITKQGIRKIKITVDSDLPGKLNDTLVSDLILCDYFEPVKRKNESEFVLQCRKTGNLVIEEKLFESTSGQMILGKRFSGTPNQGTQLIHAVTDSVITALTGEEGIAQTKLAFQHNQQIYISDFDGSNIRAVTNEKCLNLFPDWSPDGKKIVYTSYLYGYPQTFIYDTKNAARNRICGYPGLNTSASFSPNGKKIALTLSKDGNPEIYTINIDGTGLLRITKDGAVDTSPCWSPDGKKIAFVSNSSGSPQIYIVSSRGGTAKRITYKGSYNSNPSWSAKGDIIVYNSMINGVFQINTINVDTGEVVQITEGNYDQENPSFAPDGRHIVFSLSKGYNKSLYITDIYFRESHKLKTGAGSFSQPDWGK